jgi:hypothetical protein
MADKIPPAEIKAINDAHTEILRREKGTLASAFKAGELLDKAKRSPNKEQKWEDWLAANCPKIAPSTDRLYRLLFSNKADLEKKAGSANALAEWSIRQARSALTPKKTEEEKAEAKKKKDAEKAALEKMKQGSPDITSLINGGMAADEIVKGIKDTALSEVDLREIARGLDDTTPSLDDELRNLGAKALADKLLDIFEQDYLDDLAKELGFVAEEDDEAEEEDDGNAPSPPAPDKEHRPRL